MASQLRTKAEERFAAIEKARQTILSEHEEAAQKIAENTARLRALRLAKEAKDLAESPEKKTVAKKKAVRRISY